MCLSGEWDKTTQQGSGMAPFLPLVQNKYSGSYLFYQSYAVFI